MKKGVGSGERAPILVFFRSTASARRFPTWRAAFSRLELAQGLTMAFFRVGVPYSCVEVGCRRVPPAAVIISIRNGFNLPSCLLALSREGHVSSKTHWTFLSRSDRARAWWSTRVCARACVRVCIYCVCVCVFIKLHITAQSGPVILVILCHSY